MHTFIWPKFVNGLPNQSLIIFLKTVKSKYRYTILITMLVINEWFDARVTVVFKMFLMLIIDPVFVDVGSRGYPK